MLLRRTAPAISAPRRHAVLLLIAVLAFNLAFGAWSQPAAAVGDALDLPPEAVAICSAKGGIRYILPDGTELPAGQPDDGSPSCPCCFVCVTTCGAIQGLPTGLNVLALPSNEGATGLAWLAAATGPSPKGTFPARPPGQAPPLKG